MDFPGGSEGKASTYNAGDPGSIPGSGRSPGEGNGNTHGHHQMVNTEIRLIIFLAAKDEEALYSQQKQDPELTVAQIMNSLLPNSDLN